MDFEGKNPPDLEGLGMILCLWKGNFGVPVLENGEKMVKKAEKLLKKGKKIIQEKEKSGKKRQKMV